jgi:FkbM family methyltransferase
MSLLSDKDFSKLIPHVEVTGDEAMDVYKRLLSFLDSKTGHINAIDVGCARGALPNYIYNSGYFDFGSIKIVGIDPIRHKETDGLYSNIFYCAVDDVGPGSHIANFFINNIDQASSLLEMDFDNITSDISESSSKYYIEFANELQIRDKVQVSVVSLKSIMDQSFAKDERIDFLKIDAEGKDLDIIKSMHLEEFNNHPLFIALECSAHRIHPEKRIFKGGCHKNEVISYMESIGYSVLDSVDCEYIDHNKTQMSDMVFVHETVEALWGSEQ